MKDLLKKEHIPFLAFILIGIILRLLWPMDMEWKFDEEWMFTTAHEIASGQKWTWIGMPSGGGIENPGLSVLIFAFFALFTKTPIGMVQMVMLTNIIAIIGFIAIILKKFKNEDQTKWLWGMALMSVAPMAVLFSRKIWAQDVLPLFMMITFLGHTYRSKHWGSLLWGIFGALLGQIHMSGFFFAFAVFLVTLIHDKKNNIKTSWIGWFIGSTLAALPLIPWVLAIMGGEREGFYNWKNLYKFRFFYFWPLDSFGLHIRYAFKKDIFEFLKYPILGGIPTYLVAISHVFLAGVAGYFLKFLPNKLKELKAACKNKTFVSSLDHLGIFSSASIFGLAVLLPIMGVTLHEHYMIICYPFLYIWLAKLVYPRTNLMLAILVFQMIISINLLCYVHVNDGIEAGDYGKTYRSQQIKE